MTYTMSPEELKRKRKIWNKKYIETHKEHHMAYHRNYYYNHKDMFKQARRKQYLKNKQKERDNHLQYNYGITAKQYDVMFKKQKGLCAICKQPEKRLDKNNKPLNLAIDHNHSTKKVRKLLCKTCNTGIGLFMDNPELCMAAANYLRNHSSRKDNHAI